MSSTNKASFGAVTDATITLNGLANNAAREALKIDNSVAAFLDLMLELKVTLAVAAPGGQVNVYIARSLDGVKWPDVVTGADAAIAIASVQNLQHLGYIVCGAGVGPFYGIFDTAAGPNAALTLPPFFTVIIENKTGQAFAGAGNSLRYLGTQIVEVD
jgi:hypothetical protein